jgi:hypothetical protein
MSLERKMFCKYYGWKDKNDIKDERFFSSRECTGVSRRKTAGRPACCIATPYSVCVLSPRGRLCVVIAALSHMHVNFLLCTTILEGL